MAKRRRFTPQFKAEVVIEALMGQSSQAELCRRHNLSIKIIEILSDKNTVLII
ncbi:hypothetical protein C6502_07840 [Candidatus Poribacteria bacterium]|nr:MAG: hypothetical protein C6502_07840 [Candidatus Poribacteria bacterium]